MAAANITKLFKIIDAGGSGDCLFLSLALAFKIYNISYDNHETIRHRVCNYELYYEFEDPYEEDMCKRGIWGTQKEIIKASIIYGVPIIVYRDRSPNIHNKTKSYLEKYARDLSNDLFLIFNDEKYKPIKLHIVFQAMPILEYGNIDKKNFLQAFKNKRTRIS